MGEIVNIVYIISIVSKKNSLELALNNLKGVIHNLGFHLIDDCKTEIEFNQQKKENVLVILNRIKRINNEIINLNKYLSRFKAFWNFDKITEIDSKKIEFIINNLCFEKNYLEESLGREEYLKQRIKDLEKSPPRLIPREENFYLKVDLVLNQTKECLDKILDYFYKNALKFESKTIEKSRYEEFYFEVNSLFSLGYPHLALFITGRTLELILKDFMLLLSKNKKINKSIKEVKEMSAEDRLNYLKGRWISEKDFHKISSIKFDRNIVGHYNSKNEFLEAQKDSEADIRIFLNLAEKLISHLEKQKRMLKRVK